MRSSGGYCCFEAVEGIFKSSFSKLSQRFVKNQVKQHLMMIFQELSMLRYFQILRCNVIKPLGSTEGKKIRYTAQIHRFRSVFFFT